MEILKKSCNFAGGNVLGTEDYEKSRNEKSRNMENPFKFGTIVEEQYFTDRKEEVDYIRTFLDSPNHLVLISPRRFGKSSVVRKAVKLSGREYIQVNLQQITSVSDLSAQLLRELFRIRPIERLRHFITHFRVIPTITSNPITGMIDVSFQPSQSTNTILEDVMMLLENAYSEDNRLIVILDEFQEILEIAPTLDKQLRAIMQQQTHINYILLGSQESMMTDIFEKKKSPFYHFGALMRLKKLPREDFYNYLSERLQASYHEQYHSLANRILDFTDCHPYYSQQLAAHIWQIGQLQPETKDVFTAAIQEIVTTHSLDYERLWMHFSRTSKWILQRLASNTPFNSSEYKQSTIYSALKKMQHEGYVIYTDRYEIEDPFFKQWLLRA